MNTAPAWKKVFGFIALFLYCSHIYVPLHLPILNTIGSISFIVFVVLMIPEIFRDMKKFKENKLMDEALYGIRPVCIGMIFAVIIQQSMSNYAGTLLGIVSWQAVVIGLISLLMLLRFKWSVPRTILLAAGLGLALGSL